MYNEELKGIETIFYLKCISLQISSICSSTFCKWRAAPEPSTSCMQLVSYIVVTPAIEYESVIE
jgi:hypothetical protein